MGLIKCSVPGSQRKASDPLEAELQVGVSRPTWVLGMKLGSPAKVVFCLHC